MYSYEIKQLLYERNQELTREEYMKLTDTKENPQINKMKYNPIEDTYEVSTSDGYFFMFCELEDLSKKDKLDTKDVELIDKFVDIIKDINEMTMSEDPMYSQMGGGMRGYYGGGMHGSSYGTGMRGHYGRMGNMNMRGSDGYSRDASKDMMLEHLTQARDMAVDERDRRAVEMLMQQMQEN